ncbi:peptidoglycan D,D-transpeptidase FtsI family protein [Ferribacterium limneticum]|uniref:peptidoglycan D,D-transpeptidase FtsI family protein n=1 Tax=Ferribacterium limneticum TaxID=76259 RepID=UPI001CF8805C|nr:penicillin-binding transpeptidase domain-containing protein [Ferribacterium limneticum]UCV22542.1 penicillin-binding protein 2 [Ferribacterium limneticum]
MTTSTFKWMASLAIAAGITLTNLWILNHLVGHGRHGLLIAQAWSGVVIILGLCYAAGQFPKLQDNRQTTATDRQTWLKAAIWTFVCSGFPWLTLPAGGALGLFAAACFIVLIWRTPDGDSTDRFWRSALLAGLLGFTALLASLLQGSPYRLARLMADFSGPLDLLGRHYDHGLVLRTLFGVHLLGEASNTLPERINNLMLLRISHWQGALPAALVASAVLMLWQQIHAWLIRIAPGIHLSPGMKRLGLALVALHGISALGNVLWNFGLTRQSFGLVLPPLTTNAAWWLLSACLTGIMFLAYRQNAQAHEMQPISTHRVWQTAGALTGFAALVSFGLLLAIDSAKDVYAANRAPEAKQIVRRGITDRNGTPIATSTPAFDLWLIPKQFWGTSPANPGPSTASAEPNDQQRRTQLLGAMAEWPQLRTIVEGRINGYGKSDEQQKILAWAIKPEVAEKISATGLSGLKLTQRPARHYPQGGLFAHPLGFVSLAAPTHGQDGLELAENLMLLHMVTKSDADDPPPLQTTLDPEIQHAAITALNEGIASHGAKGGAAVVIEASTGKIRAMVSSPGFDANYDSSYRNPYQPERILNRARGINFPVGSLLTPLLAAHMIETGRMKPATTISIGHKLNIGKTTIVDVSPNDTLTLTEIVTKSSNIGQAKLALSLPLAELRDVTRHLGIGEPLHIRGLIGNMDYESIKWSNWTPQMHAQPGLHITTNLLQAMRAYLPLANGGKLEHLSLIESSTPGRGHSTRILSESTVKTMRDILNSAAGPTGTAPLAQVPGVMVAGKTGTTIASNGHPVTAFIGMAPAEQPRYLIGVLLEFPDNQIKLAGNTAAPVFARLVEKIIESEKAQTTPEPDRQFARLASTEPANT